MAVKISGIEQGSHCAGKGIEAGHMLVSINGNAINDVLDYRFYMLGRVLTLSLENHAGEPYIIKIRKSEYAETGLTFDTYLMDAEKSCKNKCCFCFIDQLPPGLRESLYFKDDDSRLGFLFGNYITLTNLGEDDINRIIKMHISPVNISVHTMNPALRIQMMKNPRAGEVLKYIPMLTQAGIKVNAQLVLCPGINDGDELKYSLDSLLSLGENLQSCSCVPVGLTKYRDGLEALRLFTRDEAGSVIEIMNAYGDEAIKKYNARTFFASDEFYLTAGLPVPNADWYEDFYQLENGVGMSSLFEHDFIEALEDEEPRQIDRKITIATGKLAFPLIQKLTTLATDKFPGLSVNVIPITNNFFGEDITVAGLITGSDIISELKGKKLGDELFFPASMLRFEGDLFLDGMSMSELGEKLGVPVRAVDNDGYSLFDAIANLHLDDSCGKP